MTFNILCHRLLPPYSLLSMPKIWHITVRNIEIFFCFCKLDDFSAHKFFGIYGIFITFAKWEFESGNSEGNQGANKIRGVRVNRNDLENNKQFPRGENRRRLGYFFAKRGAKSAA